MSFEIRAFVLWMIFGEILLHSQGPWVLTDNEAIVDVASGLVLYWQHAIAVT